MFLYMTHMDSSHKNLRALAAHLTKAIEEERRRIAREIHDELGQSLTALRMDLTALKKKSLTDPSSLGAEIDSMLTILDQTLTTVKIITSDLRPGVLDQLGLVAAMDWQLQEFRNRSGLTCDAQLDESLPALPEEIQIAVFRIFQELLTNILRHAIAKHVTISLSRKRQNLMLMVHDDGIGIETDDISSAVSLGIIGMKERTEFLGGLFEIHGNKDSGTTVVVEIPLTEKARSK